MAISAIGRTGVYTGVNTAAMQSMSSLIAQRAQIKNGSYGKLMKAYVGRVGNRAALEAYRTTGSTVGTSDVTGTGSTESASTVTIPPKKKLPRSTFLDDHLKSIGKPKVSRVTAKGTSFIDRYLANSAAPELTGVEKAIADAERKTGRAINADGDFVDLSEKYTSVKAAQEAAAAAQTQPAGSATEASGAAAGQTQATGSVSATGQTQPAGSATATADDRTAAQAAADRYAALRSTWLDDYLKSYTRDGAMQTVANTSVAINVAV